ncbi:MAG TPA: DUF4198 domain-containing protein [Candidatus Krumholzibacteria bacterium]|nr:DUF4198 domain-containing protein [Candidatus Krumholzibacteria bacterium]
MRVTPKTPGLRRARVAAWLGAGLLLLAPAVFAHDTWILVHSTGPGRTVELHITSGMNFPEDEAGPRAARVAECGWRLGDRSGVFGRLVESDSALVVTARTDRSGTAVAWAAFKPREIDLDDAEVEEYLDEIGAPEKLRRTWESAGAGRVWHETYTKYAKTFVSIGDGDEDPSCIPALGSAIELVPLRDPTVLAAGDSIVVRVLKKGYSVSGQAVGAVCGDDGSTEIKYSNKSGHVAFALHRGGPWLLRATELRRQSDGTWTSDFTTMTFFARD